MYGRHSKSADTRQTNAMRSLRSSSSHQLSVPRHNLSFGSRAFRFSAPRVWNSLPVNIRESHSLPTFRCNLKTFYSQSAYPHFSCPPCLEYLCPRALILLRLWHYINHVLTYLLTYVVVLSVLLYLSVCISFSLMGFFVIHYLAARLVFC